MDLHLKNKEARRELKAALVSSFHHVRIRAHFFLGYDRNGVKVPFLLDRKMWERKIEDRFYFPFPHFPV
jgi:hypothetical protein